MARIWPHRSLPRRGFVGVIALAASLILIPLLSLLGTPALWGLLPFTMGAIWLLWHFLQRNYRDRAMSEELSFWDDYITLVRIEPHGRERRWEANPHWVRVRMRETGGPVSDYVTLRGAGREVEIGAFLSPEERTQLYRDIQALIG